jgi:hypothetical protein
MDTPLRLSLFLGRKNEEDGEGRKRETEKEEKKRDEPPLYSLTGFATDRTPSSSDLRHPEGSRGEDDDESAEETRIASCFVSLL